MLFKQFSDDIIMGKKKEERVCGIIRDEETRDLLHYLEKKVEKNEFDKDVYDEIIGVVAKTPVDRQIRTLLDILNDLED